MPLFPRAPQRATSSPAGLDLAALLPTVRTRVDEHRRQEPSEIRAAVAALADRHRTDEIAAVADAIAIGAAATQHVLGVDLHPPQLLAGLGLATGHAVELRTGEGKTFAAIGPALLLAAVHGTVHLVTANPYLAERDSAWSGRVMRAAGLTTGVTLPGQARSETRRAYQANVVFGAGSDFGFDHLRDQLVVAGDPPVQRGRPAAIIDEVDAVLLDNARTPLVLSGPAVADVTAVLEAEAVMRPLLARRPEVPVVEVDPSLGHVELTDAGIDAVEATLGIGNLYGSGSDVDWPFLIHNALRAHLLLRRERDYVVRDGRIAVVDELTGRVLPGRRWSDGLHQAVEAKEGLTVTSDRRPLGRITIGSYFSGYDVLSGMSGTLEGAEDELRSTYGLATVKLPTNRPIRRVDHQDLVVADDARRGVAIADDTAERHRRGQPVLIGTVSIRQAREVSELLTDRKVPHRVLTATNDAEEAAIIAEAGGLGAVTVATQMAGRGVDIVLGSELGGDGLMVWGAEHHPSRRLDDQLRGRAGRQGDPGESRFVALESEDVDLTQRRLEELDAAARRDVRLLDGPIDGLHDLLAAWRRAACDAELLGRLLDEAIDQGRTRREAVHVRAQLDRRRLEEVGGHRWSDVTAAVLRDLLLVLWSDALDHLDTAKSLVRIGHLFGAERRLWIRQVETRWASFRVEVQRGWIVQLLSAQIVHRDVADEEAAPLVPLPPRPRTESAGSSTRDEVGSDHHWPGFSLNVWWRRHFGMVPPDPPLLLELDAIGDATPGAVRAHLDHDDPTRSRIVIPRGEGVRP